MVGRRKNGWMEKNMDIIQYKHKYYYSDINLVEFRGHSKLIVIIIIVKKVKIK